MTKKWHIFWDIDLSQQGGGARTHNIYPWYVMQSEYISEQGYAIYMFCNTFIEYALSGKKERNK